MPDNWKRTVTWAGRVNLDTTTKVTDQVMKLFEEDQKTPITLLISSSGGSSPAGFSFFDLVMCLKIPLRTVGMGFVDSMAVVLLLTGERRLVSPHTTMTLHQSALAYEKDQTIPLAAAEATLKDLILGHRFYCDVIIDRTKISSKTLEKMLLKNTVLGPKEMVKLGFAHKILTPGSLFPSV